MELPNAVHHDARGERRGFLHDGLGKLEAAAAGGESAGLAVLRGEGGEEAAGHDVAGVVRVAALHQLKVAGLAGLEIEDGALVVRGGNDEERGVLDGGGHRHVEVRRVGLEADDFLFDDGDLVGEVGGRGLFLLQFVALLFERGDGLTGSLHGLPELVAHRGHLGVADAREDAGDAVVVGGGDGVGLVVVTAGAGEREAEERAAERVHMLLPFVGHGAFDEVGRELEFLPVSRREAEEGERVAVLRRQAHLVSGNLPHDKLVVGHVVVEGLDDPVAVEVRAAGLFQPRSGLVHVAREIEPVAGVAFAVVGRCEQAVDGIADRRLAIAD